MGEVIDSYGRAQAIEDGVLIDVSEPATRMDGFKMPVAMTAAAFGATVAAGASWHKDAEVEPDQFETLNLPAGQTVDGRLHDVFWLLRVGIKASKEPDRVRFRVWIDVHGTGKTVCVQLWASCGPGDQGEPVITIMLQGED